MSDTEWKRNTMTFRAATTPKLGSSAVYAIDSFTRTFTAMMGTPHGPPAPPTHTVRWPTFQDRVDWLNAQLTDEQSNVLAAILDDARDW